MKLENGTICTLRNGDILTVVYNFMHEGFPYNVLWDGKSTPSIFVEDYLDDLTMRKDCELLGTASDKLLHGDDSLDIMQIEMDGKIVWDREGNLFISSKPIRPTDDELEAWFPELKSL